MIDNTALRLGPFALESRLGTGGMGEVWRGRHASRGTAVALKFVTAAYALESDFVSSFGREVAAMAQNGAHYQDLLKALNRHLSVLHSAVADCKR